MSYFRVVSAPWNSPLGAQALAIRFEVFVDEQYVPAEEEQDDIDDIAHHVVAFDGNKPVATGRLFTSRDHEKVGKIGRMAVLKTYRGKGAGSAIINALLDEARQLGYTEIQLSAQLHAIPFYAKHGFKAYGDVYDDAGILHRMMKKFLL